ncbi:hypothetical protein ACNOYE_10810 [Nannocystaceae bacterium ST9]
MVDVSMPSSFGGLLFPLDMFRPTTLAAVLTEGLVSQVKNILDAKLVLTRHPEIQVVIARIEGSVVGGDEAQFWRDNVELALLASQVLPRQLFLYYVVADDGVNPEPRQGFVVAQRGQVLAAEDATADQLPPDALPEDWPVERLLAQLGLSYEDLAAGFAGGPSIELSLVEPGGDDRELLMTLAGQPTARTEGAPAATGPAPAAGPGPAPAGPRASKPAGRPAPAPAGAPAGQPGAPAKPKRITVEEDQKRRAAEQQAANEAREAKAASIRADLPYLIDELGVVVAPKAELGDTDILEPFLTSKLAGDLPAGLPRELHESLQGKRIDFVVKVEFLSEVFVGERPLVKPTFDAQAETRTLAGQPVKVLEVLGPRLGKGTFIRRDRAGVFVSRTPDLPLPEALIVSLLDKQG